MAQRLQGLGDRNGEMITREPALGSGGLPGQKIYEGCRLLGTITRKGDRLFSWIAENGKWSLTGYCLKPRSGGLESTAEDAERAIVRAIGITQDEFE